MKDYHINVFYSEEDGGYIADIPDLEACSAFGSSPEEALREVETAKSAWVQAARQEGKPIPPPRYRPAIYQISESNPQLAGLAGWRHMYGKTTTGSESLQMLKRVPWDPEDLARMQRALDRGERPGWLDRLRSRTAWRLLGLHLAFSPFGTPPKSAGAAGRLWWKLRYWVAWVLEPPNAPISSRFWPLVSVRMDQGGSLMVRWGEKPQILVNGDPLEDDQLLVEWPLIRHIATGAPVTQNPVEGEIPGREFKLSGRPARFRFRKTGIEEGITLTVEPRGSDSPALTEC